MSVYKKILFSFFAKNDNFFWLLLDTGGQNDDRESDSGHSAATDCGGGA